MRCPITGTLKTFGDFFVAKKPLMKYKNILYKEKADKMWPICRPPVLTSVLCTIEPYHPRWPSYLTHIILG